MEKDAYEDALEKAGKFHEERTASRLFERDDHFEVAWLNSVGDKSSTFFPFKKPREPQPGDLYHVWDSYDWKERGIIRRLRKFDDEGFFIAYDGAQWYHCKPTGYRWDTETQSIVPIEEPTNE